MFEIIICTIAFISATVLFIYSYKDRDIKGICSSIVLFVLLGITLMVLVNNSMPQAIDVYRGKTTLQITYRDGIPVDTVVVFKTNDYECN